MDDGPLIDYLNRADVRGALQVRAERVGWQPCVPLFYQKKYSIQRGGLARQLNGLCDSKRNLSMLLYNGDLDLFVNFMGVEWLADSLNRSLVHEWSAWRVNEQVAGFVKHYQGLSFVTINGAGRMVAQDRPAEASALIAKWLDPGEENDGAR